MLSPSDLWAEFTAAAGPATRRCHFDELVARGVPKDFLWLGPMRFGVAEVATDTDGTYQPMPGGRLAYIVPARPLADLDDDEWGTEQDLVDLVAFFPDEPGRWWVRTGAEPILHPFAIARAEIMREPLEVHSTPLDWLRAMGRGCVVLDPHTDLRFQFGGVAQLVVSERVADFALEIERRLRAPPVTVPAVMLKASAR